MNILGDGSDQFPDDLSSLPTSVESDAGSTVSKAVDVPLYFPTGRPEKTDRAVVERTREWGIELIGDYADGLAEILLVGGSTWPQISPHAVGWLQQEGWFNPSVSVGALDSLWASSVMSDEEKGAIYRSLWRRRGAGISTILAIFRVPPVLTDTGYEWLRNRHIVPSFPKAGIRRTANQVVFTAVGKAPAAHRIKLERLNKRREHDPSLFYYIWRVLGPKEWQGLS